MFKTTMKIQITKDDTQRMHEAFKALGDVDILVGIPQEDSARSGGNITNAELAYIHTHGVRTKAMQKEMAQSTSKDSSGVLHTPEYDHFLKSMGEGMTYSAAYAMYIQSHGSALWQIPPRPIIEPAIELSDNKAHLVEDLQKIAEQTLDGNADEATVQMQRTGMDAQNMVRGFFVDPRNEWPENAPSTIEEKGSEQPLIDTAELRRSITYVVRKRSQR